MVLSPFTSVKRNKKMDTQIPLNLLPHNDEAEKAVLGAMIRSNAILNEGISNLDTTDFYPANKNNRAIFSAMKRLFARNEKVDVQAIINELTNAKELEVAGGAEYLLELIDSVITFENIPAHIQMIKDQAILRSFLTTLGNIQKNYLEHDISNVNDFLTSSEHEISLVTERRNIAGFRSAKDVTASLYKQLEVLKVSDTDDTVTGIPTGFPRLNKYTHGFQPGNLVVLAARPGVGKTAFALNLAFNAATRGYPVAYFSLEMPAEDLFKRLLAGETSISHNSLVTGYGLNEAVRRRIKEGCNVLSGLKIYCDNTSGIKLLDLVANVRKLKAKEPDLALVIVDYIGLISPNKIGKEQNRQLEIQQISQTLKKIALELKIAIIAVAQLNRNVEQRGGEPMLSDLRESGSLEQDADIVIFLSQTSTEKALKAFKANEDQAKASKEIDSAINTVISKEGGGGGAKYVNAIVAKNRSGQNGRVPLIFRADYVKFDTPTVEGEKVLLQIEEARADYFKLD